MRGIERRQDKPWLLIFVIIMGVILGIASVPLQVITLSRVGTATQADVERNRDTIRRVERAQWETCKRVVDIARQAGIPVEPCPMPGP